MQKIKVFLLILFLVTFCLTVLSQMYQQPQAVPGEYIVKYKNSIDLHSNKITKYMDSGITVKDVFTETRLMHISVDSEWDQLSLLTDPDFDYVEPNYILSVDPYLESEHHSDEALPESYKQSKAHVQVTESWAFQKPNNLGGKIIVAVVDTGLDRDHLLFKNSVSIWNNLAELNGTDEVDDDRNGLIDDYNGWNFLTNDNNINDDHSHGTHVSGIVLGVGQDILADSVRESKIKIMGLKFLNAAGVGTMSNAIKAMEYAIRNGARVINNSWGCQSFSQSLLDVYAYANNQGVLVVSAAGNSNTNNDVSPFYPASFNTPNNISVLASTDNDIKASFSNYGTSSVSVGAPGVAIISSAPEANCEILNCFQTMSGTSMAVPFISGLAALVLREAPQLSAYQVKNVIIGTADIVTELSGSVAMGGRVNAYRAVLEAKKQVNTEPWTPQYSSVSTRTPASSSNSIVFPGCGLIKTDINSRGSRNGSDATSRSLIIIFSMLLPFFLAVKLRMNSSFSLGTYSPKHR